MSDEATKKYRVTKTLSVENFGKVDEGSVLELTADEAAKFGPNLEEVSAEESTTGASQQTGNYEAPEKTPEEIAAEQAAADEKAKADADAQAEADKAAADKAAADEATVKEGAGAGSNEASNTGDGGNAGDQSQSNA